MTGGADERLADAVRELTARMAATAVPDATAAAAEAAVRQAIEHLATGGSERVLSLAGGGPEAYRRHNPVSGRLNPLAPPLCFESTGDGTVEASVTFGIAYQGPPGYAHGGFIAGVFDDALGAANVAAGAPGMTVRLEVRYRRPTPLDTPLRLVARHAGRDGRRILASATLHAGDTVTAEAEGVFAEITMDRARQLFKNLLRGGSADDAAV